MSFRMFDQLLDPPTPEAYQPTEFARLPAPEFTTPSEGSRLVYHLLQLAQPHGCVAQFCGSHDGEGTSTLVRDTALIAGGQGVRVALLDLAFPGQAQAMALRALIDCRPWHPGGVGGWPGAAEIQFLQCGQSPLYVSEMMAHWAPTQARCAELFGALRRHFDLVLIDTPPLSRAADAVLFAQHITTSVLVMTAESTRMKVVEELRNRIADAGGHIAGVALNRRRFHIPKAIYDRL